MPKPVDFEGVALASSAVLNSLLSLLTARGILGRADCAVIMDESLMMMEELAAVSGAAASAHTHLLLMQARLLGPDGPPAAPAPP